MFAEIKIWPNKAASIKKAPPIQLVSSWRRFSFSQCCHSQKSLNLLFVTSDLPDATKLTQVFVFALYTTSLLDFVHTHSAKHKTFTSLRDSATDCIWQRQEQKLQSVPFSVDLRQICEKEKGKHALPLFDIFMRVYFRVMDVYCAYYISMFLSDWRPWNFWRIADAKSRIYSKGN